MLPGLLIGHSTNLASLTGCTVLRFLPPYHATAAISIQGSAPGTRETDSLDPINMIDKIHAIVLTGGSAYGLETASGVMKQLEREGIGKDVGGGVVVPIVAAAVLFDLDIGDKYIRPGEVDGMVACQNAWKGAEIKDQLSKCKQKVEMGNKLLKDKVEIENKLVEIEGKLLKCKQKGEIEDKLLKCQQNVELKGNIGAGTGATVGKILGMEKAMKSGIGSAYMELGKGIKLQAFFVVNSIGNVIGGKGEVIAGIRGEKKGSFISAAKEMVKQNKVQVFSGKNTTIGVVAINIPLNKIQLKKVAGMAHDGMARAINPVHTMYDGDAVFAVSIPEEKFKNLDINLDIINLAGVAAAEVTSQAIRNAVLNAESVKGFPSHSDWCK